MSAIPTLNGLKARVAFRTSLENGILPMPLELGETTTIQQQMWSALWNNYLNNRGNISTPYWFDKFNDPKSFNIFIKALSDLNWINSIVIPNRHWAEITLNETKLYEYLEQDDVTRLRTDIKFAKYRMTKDIVQHKGTDTRQNGTTKDTGLVRDGFARSGTHTFKYDTKYISKYYDAITLNVTKSMRKIEEIHPLIEDGADYKSIAKEIIDFHLYSPDEEFTLGKNFNDSRGRAISSSLRKIFNPIGFKDARALLIQTPAVLVQSESVRDFTKACYLFIAELHGIKRIGSEAKKATAGRQFYKAKALPELDLYNDHDLKDLHELIWLERIYDMLDSFFSRDTSIPFYCDVPIELDANASMLQVTGALLNDSPLLESTNCITKTGITDPWYIDGLSRKHVKKVATPSLYGSSQTVRSLWSKAELDFTSTEIGIMNHELSHGSFSVANDFKDLIIDNVQPTEFMNININNEKFTIQCNRFRNVGDYTRRYPIYSTSDMSVLAIAHTHTHKTPDLLNFKRFFQTLLIHNLDSQVADSIAKTIPWILTIHDAFIVSPVHALQVRKLYAKLIEGIHSAREQIINNYFKSINISKQALKSWIELNKTITPVKGKFACDLMALK